MSTSSANTVPKDPQDWFQWVASRLRILERHRHAGDPAGTASRTTVVSEVVASTQAGWSITAVEGAIMSGVGQVTLTVNRTGPAVTSIYNGNITNVLIANLLSKWWPVNTVATSTGPSGQMIAGYIDQNNGGLVLSAMLPNIDASHTGEWATGTTITMHATYILKSSL